MPGCLRCRRHALEVSVAVTTPARLRQRELHPCSREFGEFTIDVLRGEHYRVRGAGPEFTVPCEESAAFLVCKAADVVVVRQTQIGGVHRIVATHPQIADESSQHSVGQQTLPAHARNRGSAHLAVALSLPEPNP